MVQAMACRGSHPAVSHRRFEALSFLLNLRFAQAVA